MVNYAILNMSHFHLSYIHIFRNDNHKGFQGVVHPPTHLHCHMVTDLESVTVVPLIDQISLTKQEKKS